MLDNLQELVSIHLQEKDFSFIRELINDPSMYHISQSIYILRNT